MPKPPRAACALLASGLLAACSRGPASTPVSAPATAAEPPASSQSPASPGPDSPPSTAAQPPAAPVQPGPASPASTVQPSSGPQAPAPTTPQPSATPAPAAAAPLPPAPALPLSPALREVAAVGPGGAVTALARTGETVVDPAATFRVELSVATADARLVLLDAADALVAASSSREVGATTTGLRVSPSVPLEPGSRYTLRIEGAVTRELHDASGKSYAPAALALRAAGQPPPPEPKAKPKKRRR